MFKKILTSTILSLVAIGGFIGYFPIVGEKIYGNQQVYAVCGPGGCYNDTTSTFTSVEQTQETTVKNLYIEWVTILNQVLYALTFIVSPAIMLAGWLMSPDWTSGDLFGIRSVLHSLWVIVSNITYFVYAILLIFIALATIFNSDKYGYKQLLPKLALGIILVPLTWWFVQFIISLSSVVTASVINIPVEALTSMYDQRYGASNTEVWFNKPIIPRAIVHDAAFSGTHSSTGSLQICESTPSFCTSPREILTSSSGMYGGLMVYAYGIFRFQDSFRIDNATDAIRVIAQLLHQGLVMALMFLVFGLLTLGLIGLLLLRAIKLWFYAIFSPLMTLKYVIGDGMFGKDGSDTFDLKEFIGLAFVPAVIGLALSFGLVIIASLHITGSGTPGNPNPTPGTNCMTSGGCQVSIMGTDNFIRSEQVGTGPGAYTLTTVYFGGIAYAYLGSVSGVTGTLGSVVPSALSAAGGFFGTIIIDIIALIFIWVAFMAAKNVTKVANTVLTPIESFGNKMAGTAKYVPIPFTGGKDGTGALSISSIGKISDRLSEIPQEKANKRLKESSIGKRLGFDGNVNDIELRKVIDRSRSAPADVAKVGTIGRETFGYLQGNAKGNFESHPEAYNEYMKALKVTLKDRGSIKYVLEGNGMDKEIADKLASKIADGKDMSDSEVVRLWSEAGKKPGSTTGKEGQSIYQVTQVMGEANKNTVNITMEGIDVTANLSNNTIGDFSDKSKLSTFMQTLTKKDFFDRLPKNLPVDARNALIAKMEAEGRKFKEEGTKPADSPKT